MALPLFPVLPRFATGAAADVTEPTEALKTSGWVGGATPDRPAAQHFNWLLKQSYEAHLWWLQFLVFHASKDWVNASNPFPAMDSDSVIINQVAYSSSLDIFVAVGQALSSSAKKHLISSSPDLSTWTIRQNIAATGDPGFVGVRWISDASLFVAFGSSASGTGAGVIYTSPDGTTWTNRTTSGFGGTILDVEYDPISALWIAIDATSVRTSTSITSPSWTSRDTATSYKAIAVDKTNGIICVGCASPISVRRSTDGTTYSSITLPDSPGNLDDIIYDDVSSKFLAALREPTTSYPALAHSANGATGTWTGVPSSAHGVEENLAPYRLGINPDYGSVMMGTYTSRVFVTFPYQSVPFFERENPVGAGLWTGVSNANYFRPTWNMQPASKLSRFWLLGGNSVGSSNEALAESQTPIY